ncbi:MAG: PQQ-dependent sugar dehydrogenase [Planctomycetes bacterium]|nr:PQQ-dependent sugar dehydrogenase [Planctomycetota bacterium]
MIRAVAVASAVLSVALSPCSAQEADEGDAGPRQGPAIAYVDAFPGQESFPQPLFVAYDAKEPKSAFVVCQPGFVYRVPRDGSKEEREVFLDLSDKVLTKNWEEGLLGFQFDPDYADNGHVWTFWSEQIEPREEPQARGKRKSDRQSVIARYTVVERDGRRVVDVGSELRVLEVFQPFGNHNGGTIVFGPDRMLYIALGDGGHKNDIFGNSESLRMLLGKVLRIDVRAASADAPYAIPKDNPFVGRDGARGEIWCYGLRNVWRMSFDRETGELWAADVGQNRIEEVDRLVKGGFYGWNSFEAHEPFELRRTKEATPPGHILPVASYPHRDGLSVTGGYVYRGAAIPALRGWYVYSDFITKRAWACRETDGGKGEVVKLAGPPFPPSSYAETPDGELLVTCYIQKKGKVYKLVPAGE